MRKIGSLDKRPVCLEAYEHLKKQKHLESMGFSEVVLKRFCQKVEIEKSGCWKWLSNITGSGNGYGSFSIKGHPNRAHRVAYTIVNGDIPDGLVVMHSCDNTRCVNSEHLSAGTQRDNVHDLIKKGHRARIIPSQRNKTHCRRGHEFTKENTSYQKSKYRMCRTCNRIRSREFKKKARLERYGK